MVVLRDPGPGIDHVLHRDVCYLRPGVDQVLHGDVPRLAVAVLSPVDVLGGQSVHQLEVSEKESDET